ncbi:hypothetical protein DPX16_5932 [Anabarilius grahami]|uniref:Uncharacterized protein n=1 Tax=Anabarilius grahami TaxID=495550 RepID=A0A3N0Y4D4_ANAGA|nr:hypothetical protein DPX16_5932 [Anabarilius grahami]
MSASTARAKKPISPQRRAFLLRGEHSDLPSRPGEGNQRLFPLAETNQATQITGKSQKKDFEALGPASLIFKKKEMRGLRTRMWRSRDEGMRKESHSTSS